MTPELILDLAGTEIFEGLDDSDLSEIALKSSYRDYAPGADIVHEGEPSDRLFIIINGIVSVRKKQWPETEQVLAYLLPGNSFGEIGILENKPRSATISAMSDVRVLVFQREDFLEILLKYPKVSIGLAKLLGFYLTETNKRLSRGNREKKLIWLIDTIDCGHGFHLAWSLAAKLAQQSDYSTVFLEYPRQTRSSYMINRQMLDNAHSRIHIPDPDAEQYCDTDNRLTYIIDSQFNQYDYIVLITAGLQRECLSLLHDYVDQVVIFGRLNRSGWALAREAERRVHSRMGTRQCTVLLAGIEPESGMTGMLDLEPDFILPSFSIENTSFNDTCLRVADCLVDRLQRSVQIGILIPTRRGNGQHEDHRAYVASTLEFLGTRFGGATSQEAVGIWNSRESGLIDEKIHRVHAYATAADLRKYMDEVLDYARKLKAELQQEAIALEINQKLTLV